MWFIPADLTPDEWMGPISNGMIFVGVVAIASAFAPRMFSEGGHDATTPMTARSHRIWRRIKIGILVFGLGLIVAGTLIQIYWI